MKKADAEALKQGSSPLTRGKPDCMYRQKKHAGSSPLTRGKRVGGVMPAGIGGLIPAHAGKTGSPSFVPKEEWAHPRSRGENSLMFW